jgi:hypothetical protein
MLSFNDFKGKHSAWIAFWLTGSTQHQQISRFNFELSPPSIEEASDCLRF